MKDEGRSERGPSMLSLRANQHSRMSVAKSLLGMTALIAVWATAATGVQSPSALAQQPCSVTLEGFEVTQAIQTFHKGESSPPALDNAVRLVAGRATTVRVYLDSGDACIVQGVGGTLEYSTALAGARQIQVADNGTITVNGGETNKQRRSASPETDGQAYKTLNYTFTAPVDWSQDSTGMLLRFKPNGAEEFFAGQTFVLHTYHHPTRVAGILMDADGDVPTDIAKLRPGSGDQMLWGVWPFPEQAQMWGPLGGYKLYEQPIISSPTELGGQITPGIFEHQLAPLMEWARVWVFHPMPEYLYGWVSSAPGTMPMRGVSCVTATCSVGLGKDAEAYYKRTFAHEFGHALRGNSNHTDVTLAPELGFDVKNRLELGRLKPEGFHDIMVEKKETDEAWINSDVYDGIEGVLQSLLDPPGPTVTESRIIVPVSADLTSISGLSGHLDVTAESWAPLVSGQGELKVLDDQGAVLASTRVEPGQATYDDPAIPSAPASGVVHLPYESTATQLKLYKDGILQETVTRSSASPVVTVTTPSVGHTLTETLTVTWTATDSDGDDMRAAVIYSADGTTWVPVGIDESGATGSASLPTAGLASTSDGNIRVLVRDGFNTTVAEVGDLVLSPNRPPKVWISSPVAGTTYLSGSNVMLVGGAYDLEDESLPSSAMQWFSDVDGPIGNGAHVNTTTLSAGPHQIEFRVTDGDSATTSVFVGVTVQ